MPGQLEARLAPRGDEFVRLVPAVEANAERVTPQYAEDLSECGFQPSGIVVVDPRTLLGYT